MADQAATKSKPQTKRAGATGRLFVLDLSGGRVLSINPDGTDKKVLATGCHLPDGVVVDLEKGHIYWTNMGVPNLNDGLIERADLDGGNRTTIIPAGATHTPKQLQLDKAHGKLYWCDREGLRVMRANIDGSKIETLVQTGTIAADGRDQTKWCVGIVLDHKQGKVYWTQKGPDNAGLGRIYRAGIEIPAGQTAQNRTDIEVWLDGLPEPIDLELDTGSRVLYWTDRGDPPLGNTVNRLSIDAPEGKRTPEIVATHLMEGIGIALDVAGNRMFVTDLGGSVYSAKLDGSEMRPFLFAQGNLSGVAYATQEN
jgi:DNA-binding beta-propeller fold protein YncE